MISVVVFLVLFMSFTFWNAYCILAAMNDYYGGLIYSHACTAILSKALSEARIKCMDGKRTFSSA